MTEERRQAISEGRKKFFATGVRASIYLKKGFVWNGIVYPDRSSWMKARMEDPELKARCTGGMVATARKRMRDPEYVAALTEKSHTPEVNGRKVGISTRLWRSPAYREKVVAGLKRVWASPKKRAKKAEQMRELWLDPDYRNQSVAARKKSWAKNHEARAKDIAPKISATVRAGYASGERKLTQWHTGMFYSKKMHKRVPYRSSLERTVMAWLENRPDVVEWIYESFAVPYISQGIERTHWPDFWYSTSDGRWHMLEAKPSSFLTDQGFAAKRVAMESLCAFNKMDYQIFTEKGLVIATTG